LLNAQTDAPKATTAKSSYDTVPKWELFAGYQWLAPGGIVPGQNLVIQNQIITTTEYKIPTLARGFGINGAYNFTKVLALEVNYGGDWDGNSNSVNMISGGPKFTLRRDSVNFFAHTLFGLEHLTSPYDQSSNGFGMLLGGGIDVKVSKPISIRVIEADYQYAHQGYALNEHLNSARVTSGLVFNFGGAPEIPVAASCSIDRNEVLVGEPLHATVSASNFNPKHTLKYDWSSSGGKIQGKDTGASIDTNGAAPGSYVATATVSDPKARKNNTATCSSSFKVKPLNPPQVSCTVNPGTVEVGTSVAINCACTSPDNATVAVGGWTSTAGNVAGSGNSATLTTTGAAAGPVTVGATCTDSRGLTTSTSNSVTVNNPPPPPPPVVDKVLEARLALRSVYFVTAQPTVKEPNAGMVKSQEKTLEDLATDFKKYLEARPDAHLTLEGHADVRGSVPYNQALSERRVARVKSLLVEHGVPEANLETKALGDQHNLTADEVKAAVEQNTELTKEERARVLRNLVVIKWASNRRVDVTLNAAGTTETSVRQYPFNATDSLTLIGGREADKKAAPVKKTVKKPIKKK
jgi:outer membrane protein OmpA-like peptidoglycan-associated protein